MKWVKKKFWIVTALLKEEDEEGEPLNWSSYNPCGRENPRF